MNEIRSSAAASDQGFLNRSEEAVGLKEVFSVIWRHKGLIAGTVLLSMAVAGAIVFQLTPTYTAHTSIIIVSDEVAGDEADIGSTEQSVAGMPPDLEAIASEVEVLSSRGLAQRLIDRLQLARSPEFNGALQPQSSLAKAFDSIKNYLLVWLGVSASETDKQALSEPGSPGEQRAQVIDAFLNHLEISQVAGSRVIDVAFTSQNAKLAASVANILPKLYIQEQREAKLKVARQATAWMEERVVALRKKVRAADVAVEEFRRKSGLIKTNGATFSSQQLADLSSQLSLAQAARREAEARFRQIQKLIEASGGIASSQNILTSPLIQSLREQEVALERKLGEMSSVFGRLHPELMKLRGEIHDLREKIEAEAHRIVARFRYEIDAAKAREQSLQRSVDNFNKQVADSNEQAIQLRALERDAMASQRLLEVFLSRLEEARLQDTISSYQQTNARIISQADVPNEPSFPKTASLLGLTFVGSTFIGLLLVFVIEQLDYGFRSGEEIEQETNIPVLALIPEHTGLLGRRKAPESYVLKRSSSGIGEAIRTLYTSLLFSKPDQPLKIILVTSAVPKEGKTAIVACLARMRAMAGQKVVVVDADCRKSGVHRVFGMRREPGLIDVLTGQVPLEKVIRHDKASGAHVITAGSAASNPPDILGSEQMDRFLNTLRDTYDLVILDSPPCMAVSDARILSKSVDGTVFVIRWVATRRKIVRQGLKHIATSGGNLVGLVLSRVDVEKHARYGYADSGSYSGSLKKYYGNR